MFTFKEKKSKNHHFQILPLCQVAQYHAYPTTFCSQWSRDWEYLTKSLLNISATLPLYFYLWFIEPFRSPFILPIRHLMCVRCDNVANASWFTVWSDRPHTALMCPLCLSILFIAITDSDSLSVYLLRFLFLLSTMV